MAKKQTKKFRKTLKRKYKPRAVQSESLTADQLLDHFKRSLETTIPSRTSPTPTPTQLRNSITHPELDLELNLIGILFVFRWDLIVLLLLQNCCFIVMKEISKSLSHWKIRLINIEAYNSTSRYLDDLLNIDNFYFDQMVDRIYHTELQLNKANSSDTGAPFLDLNLSISNGIVSTKIYDKRNNFD